MILAYSHNHDNFSNFIFTRLNTKLNEEIGERCNKEDDEIE